MTSRRLVPLLAATLAAVVAWGGPLAAQEPAEGGDATRDGARPATAADSLADLVGVVASGTTGEPIADARISVPELDLSFVSSSDGRFELQRVPPGTYHLRVQYLGYSTNEQAVTVAPGRVTRVVFLLERDVLELADLEVEVRRTDRSGPRAAFLERMRERRFGTFITRADIEAREPHNTSDMLRNLPGVKVTPVEWGQATVFLRGSTGDVCEPTVFLNGVPAPGFKLDNLPPEAVEGIEIYKRPSDMPAQFKGVGSVGCGAIIIWSQTGELTSGGR